MEETSKTVTRGESLKAFSRPSFTNSQNCDLLIGSGPAGRATWSDHQIKPTPIAMPTWLLVRLSKCGAQFVERPFPLL
ncbi:hypothetical protein ONR75_27350 [Rhodopseudomonas sp. P2A-2r]|uniref:hypothetical protein n=1 Tax=Rhodopseudomonas sp. P2A-2r TaxID=2991972 RepID=UPI002233FC46|nr:hypothetical protein [Rhodopseudomonas sp. P2A-2r]UZE48473.1 hypothetical protein ONR75_27350 [Rhodopseudomonas sp. P2A-2r]